MESWFRIIAATAVLIAVLALISVVAEPPRVRKPAASAIPKLERIGIADLEVGAEAVLIRRIRDGSVLFERNADKQLPIASLTKLMTALILFEESEPLHLVQFSDAAKRVGSPDDKRSQVRIGDHIKTEDVLKLLLIASDNDAAYAAAEDIGGNGNTGELFQDRVKGFVERMNERALALGLAGTHFSNPAGSDDPENYSTAVNLSTLAEYILREHPEFWSISRTQEAFAFGAKGERYGIVNTNPMLSEYPSLYGSKTGFDDEAKGALVLLYALGHDELFSIILLKSDDRFRDGREALGWLESNFRIARIASEDNR